MKLFITVLLLFCSVSVLNAQSHNKIKLPYTITNGDTLPYYTFKPVWCFDKRTFKSDLERYRYNQMKYNIKVVFPYIKEAGRIFNEIEKLLPTLSNKEKKRFIAAKEEELRVKFEQPLKNLYDTQGKLLILLINRETGNSVYRNLREVKGNVKAAILETTALANGINLAVKWEAKNYQWENEIMNQLEQMYGYPSPVNE
jgi:hypothetical protein